MIKFIGPQTDLAYKHIIIPSLGVGTAPTLALDILIASNSFKRVAFIHSKHVEPSVGYLNKNIEGGALGLPVEVYAKGEVVLVQLRSGLRVGRAREFIQELSVIFPQAASQGIYVLCALPYSLRPDIEISSLNKNIYCYCKGDFPNLEQAIKTKEFVAITDLLGEEEQAMEIVENAGLVKLFIKSSKFTKVACLAVFSEQMPDNFAATCLAKNIAHILSSNELGQVNPKALE